MVMKQIGNLYSYDLCRKANGEMLVCTVHASGEGVCECMLRGSWIAG